MDNLKTQMKNLVHSIATSTRERAKFVGDVKVQTANLLKSFRNERTAMAKTLRSDLAVDRHSRSVEVHSIRTSADRMCEGFRQSHGRMRHSLRLSLLRSKKAVATSVTSMRGIFAKELATVAKQRRHMANTQSAELSKDNRDRSHATARMIKGFHVSHTNMAHELAESLVSFTRGIKTEVSGLKVYGAPARKTDAAVKHPTQAFDPPIVLRAPIQASPEPFKWPDSAQKREHHAKVAVSESMVSHDKSGKPKKK